MGNENRAVVKRNAKDSVFCDLFSFSRYQIMLYRALHPEDDEVGESDIRTVTLRTVIANAIYNDLGILIKGRLLLLVEAQSSWSINILIRVILYFAEEWKKYIQENSLNVYSSHKINLPKPEFYVIYTGDDRKNVKQEYGLADEYFGGSRDFVDAKVRVVTDGSDGDIISQYVNFTRILDSQIQKCGRTKQAVKETIRICRDENALRDYLDEREQEVTDIMDILFDQDYITKVVQKEIKDDAASYQKAKDDAKADADTISSIRGVMSELHVSADRAMDIMRISNDRRDRYKGKV